MKFFISITLLLFAFFHCVTVCFAQNENREVAFRFAFHELKAMLDGEQTLDFERAIFITENAYWDNYYSYESFQHTLDQHTDVIKALIRVNNRADSMNFGGEIDFSKPLKPKDYLYTGNEKKKMYERALKNWAIFSYMTDTVFFENGGGHRPFSYQINDPFGMKDWRNSQVLHLLGSEEGNGNCFALTSLFKILSERLNSEAQISVAPQHIYIQHQDHLGDWYNVELATRAHPGDGSLQTLTYTHREAILNGISLRRLNKKETVALCLVYLGKSYEHKFDTKNSDFALECATLALKHDSLSLNALLLKQQVLEERVIGFIITNKVQEISRLRQDNEISETFKELEANTTLLYDLGYRQMPLYMQEMILAGLEQRDNQPIFVENRTPQPFTTVEPRDAEDIRYSTLSSGLFEEVHERKKQERYRRFILDTDAKEIVDFEIKQDNALLIDPVVFALSIDPLADKYPQWSPYSAFANNPILFIDKDGLEPDVYINGTHSTEATIALNKSSSLNITRNQSTGQLFATGNATTKADRHLLKAINDQNVDVRLETIETNFVEGGVLNVGAFMGNRKDEETGKKTTMQLINIPQAQKEEAGGGNTVGTNVKHEVLESYFGSKYPNADSPTTGAPYDIKAFKRSHNKAARIDPEFKPSQETNKPNTIKVDDKEIKLFDK